MLDCVHASNSKGCSYIKTKVSQCWSKLKEKSPQNFPFSLKYNVVAKKQRCRIIGQSLAKFNFFACSCLSDPWASVSLDHWLITCTCWVGSINRQCL